MRRFDSISDVRSLPENVAEWQQEQASREPSVAGDVLVPVLQSVVSAVLVACALTFVVVRLDYDGSWWDIWLGAFLAVVTFGWLVLLGQHRRLLWFVEKVTSQDLDGDGEVGDPGHLVFVDRERAKQESAKERRNSEFKMLLSFVEGIPLKGTGLTVWEKHLGRSRYCEFRDALVDYGFARWRSVREDGTPNKSQGWELVKSAADVQKALFIERNNPN